MNTLLTQQYTDILRLLKRGNYRGKVFNAKPLLLFSIFDAIEENSIKDNKIHIEELREYYNHENNKFSTKPSPIQYPYYHLWTESFYHLKWITQPQKIDSPSAKFIRENIEYAYLDNALWDLLQDADTRNYFRKVIEDYYGLQTTEQRLQTTTEQQ